MTAGANSGRRRREVWITAALVAVVTLLCYLPALRGEFVIWDDAMYVVNNTHIRTFNPAFISWAFTDLSTGFWLPITWISYAIDYLFWGLNPFGYHLTAIILHAFNTVLVFSLTFLLLTAAKETTAQGETTSFPDGYGMLVASGVTGAIFGLHPLHVEPVAWIGDRKDLLYTFFFLLSLYSYVKYAGSGKTSGFSRRNARAYYVFCLGFFALSLGSKGTAITLPLVLLILDYYPLDRFRNSGDIKRVIFDKIPFIILAVLVTLLSLAAQKNLGALASYGHLSLYERGLSAIRSTALYLWKLLLPLHLIPFYPHPEKISIREFEYLTSFLAVSGISLLCMVHGKVRKTVSCAWLFYLVTLLPVSGIVPIGLYSMADRYSYLPSAAPLLLAGLVAVWLWSRAGRAGGGRAALAGGGVLCLLLLAVLLGKQVKVWNNSVALWDQVIEKGPYRSAFVYNNRSMAFLERGEYELAVADSNRALALLPDYHLAHYNRGKAYFYSGNLSQALADLNRTVAVAPRYAEGFALRGDIFRAGGDLAAALRDYSTALALYPEMYEIYLARGIAYKETGDFKRAIDDYNRTLALAPDYAEAYNSRGAAYRHLGEYTRALEDYGKAIAINPGFSLAYCNRGIAYKEMDKCDLAVADFTKAVTLSPDLVKAYLEAGECYLRIGRQDLAEREFSAACGRNSLEGCSALRSIRK